MANKKRHILFPLLLAAGLCNTNFAMADEQDFATDINVSAKKDITKKLNAEIGGGIRFKNNTSELDRLSAEGGISFAAIKKWLDLEANYVFLADWNGQEDQYYSYRHRYSLGADVYHKVSKRLTMDFRAKWQSTFRVENMKTYKWNPKDYIRLKLGGDYKIKGLPLLPHASVESFLTTNNPDGNVMDDLRYNLGVKYNLNKKNTLDLSFQIDDEMNVSKPKDRFMLCLGYKYKFK